MLEIKHEVGVGTLSHLQGILVVSLSNFHQSSSVLDNKVALGEKFGCLNIKWLKKEIDKKLSYFDSPPLNGVNDSHF